MKAPNGAPYPPDRKASNGAPYPPADTVDARSFYHPEKSGKQKVITYPEESAREVGRPTRYKRDYAHQARMMAGREWTNEAIAECLQIDISTLYRWQERYPEFRDAIAWARGNMTDLVERSLASRALGYTCRDTHITNFQGTIIKTKTTKHYPPDVGAAKFWLANQARAKWSEKHQGDEPVEEDNSDLSADEMANIDKILGDCIDEH